MGEVLEFPSRLAELDPNVTRLNERFENIALLIHHIDDVEVRERLRCESVSICHQLCLASGELLNPVIGYRHEVTH